MNVFVSIDQFTVNAWIIIDYTADNPAGVTTENQPTNQYNNHYHAPLNIV